MRFASKRLTPRRELFECCGADINLHRQPLHRPKDVVKVFSSGALSVSVVDAQQCCARSLPGNSVDQGGVHQISDMQVATWRWGKPGEHTAKARTPRSHDAAEKCIAALQDDPKAKYSIIVAAESISKDASWVGPVDTAADWLFAGQKPEGTTYTMKATISTNYLGQDNTVTWDTHMTVRDGVVYWYPKIC